MDTIKKSTCSILLLIASLVWGVSFVAQSIGGSLLTPIAYNALRMFLGAVVILICTLIFTDKKGISQKPQPGLMTKKQIITGIICGIFLTIATNAQQFALNLGVPVGKAGFVTALYIVLVPVIGLFFKQKTKWNTWAAVFMAVVGLYFLCVTDGFSFSFADILLVLCALSFSFQIIVIDHHATDLDSLRLAGMEFLVCAVLSAVMAVFFEILPYEGGSPAWFSLLSSAKLWLTIIYMGVFSCGVGYSFQILGQKNLDPTLASLIMSLESVFSALSGWLILGEKLTVREISGCIIMFAAIVITQLDFKKMINKKLLRRIR